MWLNIKTEYSFGHVYGHIDNIINKVSKMANYAGIADIDNTFGHVKWSKACQEYKIKPIFGVQLAVVNSISQIKQEKIRRYVHNYMTLIARNNDGLSELYNFVKIAHDQFYYRPLLAYKQINKSTNNLLILSGTACDWNKIKRKIYPEICINSPWFIKNNPDEMGVATIDNYYIDITDRHIYEPFADNLKKERKTTLMHIPTEKEWLLEFPNSVELTARTQFLASQCVANLPTAPMLEFPNKESLEELCIIGANERKIDLKNNQLYKERFERELQLIVEKKYLDYFLVVADIINYAKKHMVVGPSRGSSAGSLVCYLLGITEIDPLKHGLYFERFIDVNRADLPDIDIDFQDTKRHLIYSYAIKKYGKDCVASIGNINRLKPRSAITRFAKALHIPIEDVEEVKDSINERSSGDARANLCIEDSFKESEIGKKFLETYPQMKTVSKVEAHASHTGIHAAGLLICNNPITYYCGINTRDNKRIGMIDKKDAETLNLLKIDALGLRTLSIIADICDSIGKDYNWIYTIPTDDKETFNIFNQQRFSGIFQFEGRAVQGLAKQIEIENLEDIAALSALGRPGPLVSGGANEYISYRTGAKPIKYIHDHPIIIDATKNTYGVVIYQEQVMRIVREFGKFSWEETSSIRKAMSRSLGVEYFDKLFEKFYKGAATLGVNKSDAKKVWDKINKMGSWSFNKSHAISYGLVSYICAYLKAHYPFEFTLACLNHAKNDNSALKILRDAVENEGIEYKHIDEKKSQRKWSIQKDETKNILIGGFETIHGIGPKMAQKICKLRSEGKSLQKGMKTHLKNDISPFKYLYPAKQIYGGYYTEPKKYNMNNPAVPIKSIQNKNGMFNILGKLIRKNTRDANETCFLVKREGKYLTGQTTWLNITIEDDTESIMCKIPIEKYEELGKEIAETGKEDKDWYLVNGTKNNNWNLLFVKNIIKITK